MDESQVSEEDLKEESKGRDLRQSLISILISEHRSRRDMIYSTLRNIQDRIEESEDEMDVSMSIDHLNEVVQSSIKNDKNIVDLIELLLKYDYDEDEVEELTDYKNELSDNELSINFDE